MSTMARREARICQSNRNHGERPSHGALIASRADCQLIAIFGAVFRDSVNPAQFGVVLTYALSTAISESFSIFRSTGADQQH